MLLEKKSNLSKKEYVKKQINFLNVLNKIQNNILNHLYMVMKYLQEDRFISDIILNRIPLDTILIRMPFFLFNTFYIKS